MINILKESSVFAYADDTAIVVSNKKLEDANRVMQNELNKITKWCHDNGLVINASKTKILHIKPTHLANSVINIKFHNNECIHNANVCNTNACNTIIESVKTYKYLGVYVDENFKWLTHINHLRKKFRQTAYSLFHLSNCATFQVLKQAYFSLAESYIRHGITAWGSSTYCKSLQQTQNQILKILLKNYEHNKHPVQYELIYGTTNNTNAHNINPNNNNTNIYNINENNTNINNMNINNTNHNTNLNNTNSNNSNINNSNLSSINLNNIDFHNTNHNNRSENNTNTNINTTHINITSHININSNNFITPNIITPNITNNNTNVNATNITNTTSNYTHIRNTTSVNMNTNTNNAMYSNRTTIHTNNRANTANNIATKLQILNIKSLYSTILINEFYNDPRFLKPIDHLYNTRRRAEGRYKVERHRNTYGKNSINIVIPNIHI